MQMIDQIYLLPSKCDKPLKPKTTLQVVSDTGQSNESMKPIKICGARFLDGETLSLGYGSELLLTFENVVSLSFIANFSCFDVDIPVRKV